MSENGAVSIKRTVSFKKEVKIRPYPLVPFVGLFCFGF